MITTIIKKFKQLTKRFNNERMKNVYKPRYKLIEILEEDDQHTVVIKLINKNVTFNTRPEEILANDHLVDQFSPRDVRALTYLGYLGINSPKYTILARKLTQNEKISFLLKKKGEKKVIVKTADEVIRESDILLSMNAEDAKTVGYTIATEAITEEKKQKEALLNEAKHLAGRDE